MTIRETAPIGAPCWVDLWTSDVDRSRRFYSQLFGWEAQAPNPDFGGYFMFTRHGAPIAGAMGDTGASDTWKIYLATDDVGAALSAASAAGAQIASPAMAVADLGTQALLVDPVGATVGLWQPGTFSGFNILDEHGAPSWFELHARDFVGALAFYRDVLGLETVSVSDTDDFRYATLRRPGTDDALAGVMDSSRLPGKTSAGWSVYWEVDDTDRAIATTTSLGGVVVTGPDITPYGRVAVMRDPAGALFKLRTAPS